MKLYALLLLSLLLTATAAHAQEGPDKWFACKSDNDCVLTVGYCSFDWAVNQIYIDEIKKAVQSTRTCVKKGLHDPNSTAKCNNSKCEIVPVYPDK